LAEALQARIPQGWPPGEYDADAMRFMLGELKQRGTAVEGWLAYYVVTDGADGTRDLVANAGYFGPPTNGMIEIGFSVVEAWRRRGIATSA
jgi:RimJ/RimL family protein N-acetyltransferase